MSNSHNANCALMMAQEGGCLNEALVIGKDDTGAIQIYCAEANKAEIVVLLERAKMQLINSISKSAITGTVHQK